MLAAWQINGYVLAALLAVATAYSTALWVCRYAAGREAVRPFIIMLVSAGTWCFFPIIASLPLSDDHLYGLARVCYAGGACATPGFLHLTIAITGDSRSGLSRKLLAIGYTLAAVCLTASFSPGFIYGLVKFAPFFAPIPGPLYHVYAAGCILACGLSFLILTRNFSRVSPEKRNQLVYYTISVIVLAASPLLHFSGTYFHYEPFPHDLLVPVFALIACYAIVRHQLLDIKVFIGRGLVYSILVALISIVYLVAVLLMERLFQGVIGYRSISSTLLAALIVAASFNPLRNWLQRMVDRALFLGTPEEMATQRDRLLEEVRRGEQMKAVSTLAVGLAHEIKNPLTAIRTFTEYLDAKHEDPEFRSKFQRIVGGELEKINHIVQQLLDFAKPQPLQLANVSVSGLIIDTLELLNKDMLQRGVQVETHFEDGMSVRADGRQLRQVFLNLFLNSLDAMESGGNLTITIEASADQVLISLADTGKGIPAKDLPHIFEPFFTSKPSGTGLGLAVVRSIIQEHGGTITAESELGKGTCMTISLPMASTRIP